MNKHLLLILGLLASGIAASASSLTINDFSSLNDGNAYFMGSWADINGDMNSAQLTQNAGYFTIANVSSTVDDGVKYYFDNGNTVLDLSMYDHGLLALTAKLGASNTASTLIIDLLSSNGIDLYQATFDLSRFNTSTFTTISSPFASVYNDLSSTYGFEITGEDTVPTNLNISLDNLAVTSAVPEPSTYAAIVGSAVLMGAIYRSRRRRRLLRAA